ncbi:uncharacterized protein LOC126267779 [Schistocerca gregaria]|uniref:uncharacterized protein LOC126267779 n=1 Tax=Schistocerca gregaria TaxID=7010 RepID=UPI00211E80C1|nr:uncharacterized protein LOC126267779 [Schistocerca gregaria]
MVQNSNADAFSLLPAGLELNFNQQELLCFPINSSGNKHFPIAATHVATTMDWASPCGRSSDLKKNHNSYHRKTYVWLCGNATILFSRDYYKKWFFEKLVSLSEDPIATVRQLTIPVLLSMKKMCQGPTDRQLRNLLRNAFIRLSNDPDDQVRDCLNFAEIQSETIECDIAEDQRLLTEELAIEERQPPVRQSRDLPGTPHVRRAGPVTRKDPYTDPTTVTRRSFRSLSQPEGQPAQSRPHTGYPGGAKEKRQN